MSFLELFKKKKKLGAFELPPPPLPLKPSSLEEEIPSIRPLERAEELPLPASQEDTFEAQQEFVSPEETHEEKSEPVFTDRTERVSVAPRRLFVSVDDYKKVMQGTNVIRAKLIETESAIKRLSALTTEETHIIEKWSKELADVERKLSRVDQVVAKAQL